MIANQTDIVCWTREISFKVFLFNLLDSYIALCFNVTRSIEVRNKKISVERNRDTKKEEEPPKSLKVVAETMAGFVYRDAKVALFDRECIKTWVFPRKTSIDFLPLPSIVIHFNRSHVVSRAC